MRGTISSPNLKQNLLIISKVIRRHISKNDGYSEEDKRIETEHKFDLDNFTKKELRTFFGSVGLSCGVSVYVQRRKRSAGTFPAVQQIHEFFQIIFTKLSLNVECAIVALLYAERLMSQGKIAMNGRNWRPILLVSILMASKMWDDLSSWNVEFSDIFPIFTLHEINTLEKLFLHELNYNLFISGKEYARYYFALRGLRYTHEQKIPRYYLDLNLAGGAGSIEERSRKLGFDEQKGRHLGLRGSPNPRYGSPRESPGRLPASRAQRVRPSTSNLEVDRKNAGQAGADLGFCDSLREESLRSAKAEAVERYLKKVRGGQDEVGAEEAIGLRHHPPPPLSTDQMQVIGSEPIVREAKRSLSDVSGDLPSDLRLDHPGGGRQGDTPPRSSREKSHRARDTLALAPTPSGGVRESRTASPQDKEESVGLQYLGVQGQNSLEGQSTDDPDGLVDRLSCDD